MLGISSIVDRMHLHKDVDASSAWPNSWGLELQRDYLAASLSQSILLVWRYCPKPKADWLLHAQSFFNSQPSILKHLLQPLSQVDWRLAGWFSFSPPFQPITLDIFDIKISLSIKPVILQFLLLRRDCRAFATRSWLGVFAQYPWKFYSWLRCVEFQ